MGIAKEPVAASHRIGPRRTSMDILGPKMRSAGGLVVGSVNAQPLPVVYVGKTLEGRRDG